MFSALLSELNDLIAAFWLSINAKFLGIDFSMRYTHEIISILINIVPLD
jgi:hypothetical protein